MKIAYKKDENGDGVVKMAFSGGSAGSMTLPDFNTFIQDNYPETPALLTADASFSVSAGDVLVLDGSDNPTGAKVPPVKPDYFSISSDKAADFDGVPVADSDGADKHVLTIQKKKGSDDTVDAAYTGSPRILASPGMPLSAKTLTFVAGETTLDVGPSSNLCDCLITIMDPAGVIGVARQSLRFK